MPAPAPVNASYDIQDQPYSVLSSRGLSCKQKLFEMSRDLAISMMGLSCSPNIWVSDPDIALHDWQLGRRMHPTSQKLQDEHSRKVHIHDGLTDREVDKAVEDHFERIDPLCLSVPSN